MKEEERKGQVLSLFLEKYRAVEEMENLTRQMDEALGRKDTISVQMVLKMRAETMAQIDRIQGTLLQVGEAGEKEQAYIRLVLGSSFLQKEREDPQEERMRKIRLKTQKLIQRIREEDRRLNLKTAGEKSWYSRREQGGVKTGK